MMINYCKYVYKLPLLLSVVGSRKFPFLLSMDGRN